LHGKAEQGGARVEAPHDSQAGQNGACVLPELDAGQNGIVEGAAQRSGHPGFLSCRLEPGCAAISWSSTTSFFLNFTGTAPRIAAISVDGAWCHLAYSKKRKLRFPLLSDFEPKGAVARSFGVYRKQEGVCERALFVIDSKGVIRWSYLSPIDVNPGADGILNALERLESKSRNRAEKETMR
jgi:hypothetical protein